MSCWLSVFQFAVIHSHSHATSNGRVSASNVKDQRAYDNSTKVCIFSTITCTRTHTHKPNVQSTPYNAQQTGGKRKERRFHKTQANSDRKKRIIKWYLYCDCYKDCIMIFVDGKRRTLTNTEHLCAAVITIPKKEERKPTKKKHSNKTLRSVLFTSFSVVYGCSRSRVYFVAMVCAFGNSSLCLVRSGTLNRTHEHFDFVGYRQ